MTIVATGTIGAMTSLVEGASIPDFDCIVPEMLLKALGLPAEEAARVARLPLPAIDLPEEPAPAKRRGRPRRT